MNSPDLDVNAPTRVRLLVPGLFGTPAVDVGRKAVLGLPALRTLLARAEPTPPPAPGLEACLFGLFGVDAPEQGGDWPVAAVTRVLDLGVVDNGWWLRADPVHLQLDRDRLILVDNEAIGITQDEANHLVAEISEVYAPDGWTFRAPCASRWYVKPPRAPALMTTPLADVVGRDIHPFLPRGDDGMAWQTILTELQILLQTAKVNEERERAEKLTVNSLWFWGGGRLPRIKPVEWAAVWSGEAVALALARLSGTPSFAAPAGHDEWQRTRRAGGEHLVVLEAMRLPTLYGDVAAWVTAAQGLERLWFAPLLAALKRRELEAVTLLTDTGEGFHVTSSLARRWWRRAKMPASCR